MKLIPKSASGVLLLIGALPILAILFTKSQATVNAAWIVGAIHLSAAMICAVLERKENSNG